MSANPLEAQVGLIVGNLLAGGGEVFFPGVGSLYVDRQGARRLSRRTVVPPCRRVAFTSQQRGVSLVDEIARVMRANGCEEPQTEAQAIYDRWIERVHKVNLMIIEGVGELRFKTFTPEEAFDLRLNPQGHEPVRVKVPRRFDWALWVGVAAIAVALFYGGREFLMLNPGEPASRGMTGAQASDSLAAVAPGGSTAGRVGEAAQPVAGTGDAAMRPAESGGPAGVDGVPEPGVAARPETDGSGMPPAGIGSDATGSTKYRMEAQPADGTARQAATGPGSESEHRAQETPMSLLSGRHYVVLGVFSTTENAVRAVRETLEKDASLRCRIYRFGAKFMVSPFSSDDAAVCAEFVRTQSARFPGLWTYTAR